MLQRFLPFLLILTSIPAMAQGMTVQVEDEEGGPCCLTRRTVGVAFADPNGSFMNGYHHHRAEGHSSDIDYISLTGPYYFEIIIERQADTGRPMTMTIQGEGIRATATDMQFATTDALLAQLKPAFARIRAAWGETFLWDGMQAIKAIQTFSPAYLNNGAQAISHLFETILAGATAADDTALFRFLSEVDTLHLQLATEANTALEPFK